MSDTPIEDYLDELLRRSRAHPRETRRVLDEAGDHLLSLAADLEAAGASRVDAEREAVRRLGPVEVLTRGSWRRSFRALVADTLRAALLLGGWGLVAVGLSGAVAAVMTAVAGNRFVGAASVLGLGGHGVAETAQDAVSLRVLAGLAGLVALGGYALLRRGTARAPVLPAGLVDALGAAAFAASTAVLAGACVDQAVTGGAADGVGFFLSGAVVSFAAAVVFCVRATRALLPHR